MQEAKQIPDKKYFTISEASKLCALKTHVLRYWEKEFLQLNPAKRCGNRRYYKREDIILIRNIKNLLYEQGFTIEGAKKKINKEKLGTCFNDCNNDVSAEVLKEIILQIETIIAGLK